MRELFVGKCGVLVTGTVRGSVEDMAGVSKVSICLSFFYGTTHPVMESFIDNYE